LDDVRRAGSTLHLVPMAKPRKPLHPGMGTSQSCLPKPLDGGCLGQLLLATLGRGSRAGIGRKTQHALLGVAQMWRRRAPLAASLEVDAPKQLLPIGRRSLCGQQLQRRREGRREVLNIQCQRLMHGLATRVVVARRSVAAIKPPCKPWTPIHRSENRIERPSCVMAAELS
jgi:hypothetical protein